MSLEGLPEEAKKEAQEAVNPAAPLVQLQCISGYTGLPGDDRPVPYCTTGVSRLFQLLNR